MSAMVTLGHFCEVHGPMSIMTTQSLSAKAASFELPAVSIRNQHRTCASCQLVIPSTSSSSSSSSSCSSQSSSSGPQTYCLKTQSTNNQNQPVTIVSSQYPAAQARYSAIRQACVRALSSEHTFSDDRPMMFSDPAVGTAIVLIFHVDDQNSRGHVRKYCLICLGEDERRMMRYWKVITPQLEQLANTIKYRAAMQHKKDYKNNANNSHEQYLRRKRDAVPKSLVTILKDDKIFVELHSKFARLLSMAC